MGDNRSPVSHMTGDAMVFCQNLSKSLPTCKTVEKIATVVKIFVVFVSNNCFFFVAVSVAVCEGFYLLTLFCLQESYEW